MGASKVWVNGVLINAHFGGYFPIHIDVTEHIQMGENVIAVRADNSNDPDYPPGKAQEQLDYTYFGGIYRDAWLIAHNEVYVTHPVAAEKGSRWGCIHSFGGCFRGFRTHDNSDRYCKCRAEAIGGCEASTEGSNGAISGARRDLRGIE